MGVSICTTSMLQHVLRDRDRTDPDGRIACPDPSTRDRRTKAPCSSHRELALHRGRHHRHLLPARVRRPAAAPQHAPVRVRRRGRSRRLPAVPAVPARPRARARLGRRARARVPRAAPHRRRRARRPTPRTRSRLRLGVSARHLRRLFAEHIGATPSEVARSRRAHFARRLLDDTDLPMTRIATAAGFQSVRHMNRVVKQVFRFTPQELRARRRDPHRLVADGGLELRLPYRAPLAWDATPAVPRAARDPGRRARRPRRRASYRRTLRMPDGAPAVIEVTNDDGRRRPRCCCARTSPTCDGLVHVVAQVRRLFDLDADPELVDPHLARDPRSATARARATAGCASRARSTRSRSASARSSASRCRSAARPDSRAGSSRATARRSPASRRSASTRSSRPRRRSRRRRSTTSGSRRARGRRDPGVRRRATVPLDGSLELDDARPASCAAFRASASGPPTTSRCAARASGTPFPPRISACATRSAAPGPRCSPPPSGLRPWRAYAAMHLWCGAPRVAAPAQTRQPA